MEKFVQWAAARPVANVQSAWAAWSEQQREIDALHAQILEMQHRMEHLEQLAFEARQRKLRLVSAA